MRPFQQGHTLSRGFFMTTATLVESMQGAMPVSHVPDYIPGPPVHVATIWRWIAKGVRGYF
jgi:hypothetical protein